MQNYSHIQNTKKIHKNFIKLSIYPSFVILLLAILLLTACSSSNKKSMQLPVQKQVKTGILENGIRYYIYPSDAVPESVDIQVLIKMGSLYEEPHELGLAHFIEHMGFNSTEKYDREAFNEIEKELGVSFGLHSNAYTSFDRVNYMIKLQDPSPDRLDKIMDVMSQRALHITFPEEEVNAERKVVLAEMLLDETNEYGKEFKFKFSKLMDGTPLPEHFPIGTREIVENASAQDLEHLFRKWYVPSRIAVAIAGDISEKEILPYLKKYFGEKTEASNKMATDNTALSGDATKNTAPLDSQHSPRAPQKNLDHTNIVFPTHTGTQFYGFQSSRAVANSLEITFAYDSPFSMVLEDNMESLILQPMLGMYIKNSFDAYLLFKQYDSALYDISASSYSMYRNHAVFSLFVDIDSSRMDEGIEEVRVFLAHIEKTLMDPNSVKNMKADLDKYMDASLASQEVSAEEVLYAVEEAFLYDTPIIDWYTLFKRNRKLLQDAITPERMMKSYQDAFYQDDNKFVFLTVPANSANASNAATNLLITKENQIAPIIQAKFASLLNDDKAQYFVDFNIKDPQDIDMDNLIATPEAGSIVSEKIYDHTETYEWKLSNGYTVFFRELEPAPDNNTKLVIQNYNNPIVTLWGNRRPELITIQNKTREFANFDGYPLTEIFDRFKSTVNLTRRSVEVTDIKEIEDAFMGLHFMFTQVDITEPAMKRAQYLTIKNLDNNQKSPFSYSMMALENLLEKNYKYYYDRFDNSRYSKVSFDEVKELSHAFDTSKDTNFFIAGDISPRKIKPYIEQWIASIPTDKNYPVNIEEEYYVVDDIKDIVEMNRKDNEQSAFIVWASMHNYEIGTPIDTKQYYISRLASEYLSLELEKQIREELGAAYYIVSGVEYPIRHEAPYQIFYVFFPTALDRARELSDYLATTLDTILPLDNEAIEKTKALLYSRIEESYNKHDPYYAANSMLSAFYDGLPIDLSKEEKISIIEKIRPEEVTEIISLSLKAPHVQLLMHPAPATVSTNF